MSEQHTSSMWAFTDESYHQADDARPGHYIMGTAIIDASHFDAHRAAVASLRIAGARKLHWHEEGHRRRLTIIDTIARLDALHVVVMRARAHAEGTERQRRKCLERQIHETDTLGVTHMVLESRGRADDQRDRKLLDTLRAKKAVGPGLRIDHRAGPDEALLWIPDAVCGAAHAAELGNTRYWERLKASADVAFISL